MDVYIQEGRRMFSHFLSLSRLLNGWNDQWAIENRWWMTNKYWREKKKEMMIASWGVHKRVVLNSISSCWCSNYYLKDHVDCSFSYFLNIICTRLSLFFSLSREWIERCEINLLDFSFIQILHLREYGLICINYTI